MPKGVYIRTEAVKRKMRKRFRKKKGGKNGISTSLSKSV